MLSILPQICIHYRILAYIAWAEARLFPLFVLSTELTAVVSPFSFPSPFVLEHACRKSHQQAVPCGVRPTCQFKLSLSTSRQRCQTTRVSESALPLPPALVFLLNARCVDFRLLSFPKQSNFCHRGSLTSTLSLFFPPTAAISPETSHPISVLFLF